jgi:hypothetical protein
LRLQQSTTQYYAGHVWRTFKLFLPETMYTVQVRDEVYVLSTSPLVAERTSDAIGEDEDPELFTKEEIPACLLEQVR